MLKIIFYHVIYFVILTLITKACIKYPIIGFLSTLGNCIMFFLFADIKKTAYDTLFVKVKRYSVYIPAAIYGINKLYINSSINRFTKIFFTLILLINILEASIFEENKSNKKIRKLNALNLFVLALLTPKLNNKLEFNNNKLWEIGYTLLVSGMILFHNDFNNGNVRFSAIYGNIIPTIFSNKKSWVSYRVYSLTNIFILDDLLHKQTHDKLALINNKFEKYNIQFEIPYTILSSLYTLFLLKKSYNKSLLFSMLF